MKRKFVDPTHEETLNQLPSKNEIKALAREIKSTMKSGELKSEEDNNE